MVNMGDAMSAQHTPGPWVVGNLDKNDQRLVRGEHFEIATCWHHCVGSIEKEMEANARLIAAAPELLEALEQVLIEYDEVDLADHEPQSFTSAINEARAAIAKAKGGDA